MTESGVQPSTSLVGRKSQPRVLLLNVSDEVAKGCAQYAASTVRASSWLHIQPSEFDVVLVGHSGHSNVVGQGSAYQPWVGENLSFVLQFEVPPFAFVLCGGPRNGRLTLPIEFGDDDGTDWKVETCVGSISSEQKIYQLSDPALDRLIREDLALAISSRGHSPHAPIFRSTGDLQIEPFMTGYMNEVLAGRYTRPGGGEAWLLPSDIRRPLDWLRVALLHWREIQPDRFRDLPGLGDDIRWHTTPERELQSQLEEVRRHRNAVLAELEAEERQLEGKLRDARVEGDRGRRRLLTAESDDLVGAVNDALAELGFCVNDVDDERKQAEANELLEDLRLTDPDEPDWVALVEVRSYRGGAQGRDLLRIGRFDSRYAAKYGRLASRKWYVVNQFRDRDPSAAPRLPVLQGQDEDVTIFANDRGAVIDTSQLFDVVESDNRQPSKIRATLRNLTGRLPHTNDA